MSATYINGREIGSRTTETIDEFDTREEAKEMLSEYVQAYRDSHDLWLSSRCTKEWRESS